MQKPAPAYTLDFVLHPEHDTEYRHFQDAAANPFDAGAMDFPRVNAWWLAEGALLSYWEPPDAIPVFRDAGFDCEFITNDSTDCYVAAQKDWIVVAFRGTQPGKWNDILSDANIVPAPWPHGMVHLGFKTAFEVIRPRLDPILQRLLPGRTLWFCGHSLGAALATLAADHYAATRGVCTFGSPRVGNSAFADAFDARFAGMSLRCVNDHDVVTHVPPPIGYEHVDVRRHIARDGTISGGQSGIVHFFEDLIGETEHLLEVVEGLSAGTLLRPPMFLLDHMPKAYAVWTWNDHDANR